MKKIVVIGGGTGTFTVLQGLREYPLDLVAIVSTADDGGSTGILRDELGVLPPGDIRQALVALSSESSLLRELFTYRFDSGGLKGHNFGNLFLSALEKVTGSFDKAVLEASRILAINGHVVPMSTDMVHLRAQMADGSIIKGEHAIEEHIWSEQSSVQKMWLEPNCTVHPLARLAIKQADLIVIAPGSIFTSLLPNLLVDGMRDALQQTKAPIVYIMNLMTERGQTGQYEVQDFVELIEQYLGKDEIDYVVYNNRMPDAVLLERYKKEMERQPVRLRRSKAQPPHHYQLVGANLLARKPSARSGSHDPLAKQRTLIRHDPAKLADVLYSLTMIKRLKTYL